MEQQAVRQLRSSEALVAGISAMLLATAVVGLASIVQPSVPFPPLGLAQRLLHVVPGALAVFFIERLGHLALRLFAIGFTLGGILAGGVAGVLVARAPVRSRARACWAAGGVFALLALAGYRSQPGAPSLALYGALIGVAAVVYATGLRGALDRLDRDTVPPAARGLGRTRREFLRAAVGAGGLLALGLGVNRLTGGSGDRGGRPLARPAGAGPVRPARTPADTAEDLTFARIQGLSSEVTPNRFHYTVDESIIDPDVDAGSWHLDVGGLVERPARLGYADLVAMASVEQYVTLQCISNFVGGDLVGTAKWTGVPLADVLARAGGASERAVRVVFHAVGGYSDSLPIAKALDRSTMVAYGMNGATLPRAHGYPARIIAPGIYGMKNVKWLERIEVVDYEYQGYWQRSDGWDNLAVVKTASRIDVPAELASVGGQATVAGVAWAGDRGIEAVEVSLDGGRTWQRAVLRRELARAAWRQWRLPWVPAGQPRRVRLQVRAVDGRDQVQTAARAQPHPDGASGYHEVEVVTRA
jgi:DMSO/TMAO reductase YedYZ molybdopterin-dependent catalytic subunit